MHMKSIKDWRIILLATLITALSMTLWITYINKHTNEAELKHQLQSKIDALNKQTTTSQQLEAEKAKLKAELEKAQKDLQAKRNRAVAYAEPVRQVFGGTCAEWVAQAGITDGSSAMQLIQKESGCNPNAINRSSGACGVAQELPCGKSGCRLGDGACQVRWMHSYILGRYGSWANALAFHRSHSWY